MPDVILEDLGSMPYREAWDYQEQLLADKLLLKSRRSKGETALPAIENHLLFVEHPPVYTLGKSGKESNLLATPAELEKLGIDYVKTNRGGDITFHGPGQLVGYPILDLEQFGTDIGKYLRNIEEVIIRTLADYGLEGRRSPGETGVWLDPDRPGRERKICAIGVRCSRWITLHGFAFNVNTDLGYFDHIIPCGIVNKKVSSLAGELGRKLDMQEIKEKVAGYFGEVFGVSLHKAAGRQPLSLS